MQVTRNNISETKVSLKMAADADLLKKSKDEVLKTLAKDVRVEGFREGKAPLNLVEKNIDPSRLQSEFLQTALNHMYAEAAREERLRPVAQPEVNIAKFVPFSELEAEATVEVVGEVKLPDYKKIKLEKPKTSVTAKEIDEVIKQLQTREATKDEVKRAAKEGDQVWIDFKGVDAKTKETIKGADGEQYPLSLGSNSFIPGFEDELIGAKAGDEREFTLTFPADYGAKELQNRKVTFTVKVTKVEEVVLPKVDDKLAAKAGPFKTVDDLKADIKKEMQNRKEQEAGQKYADEVITKIAEKTKVAIPDSLIDEQLERIENEQKQSIVYRGVTWKEHLENQGLTEEEWRKKQRPAAELRVKAGLILAEIADAEKIEVTLPEIEKQIEALKVQYPDPKMREELDKPEAKREIASRLMTEKTVNKLVEYASKK